MGIHVLLNLLNKLGKKEIKCEPCRGFYLFSAASLINSIIQEQECSYDIKNTLKSLVCFLGGKKTLSFCYIYAMLLWPSLHNVTKYING